jgi:hypothetical protein
VSKSKRFFYNARKFSLFAPKEEILPRMNIPVDGLEINDNGGTRSGRDRRKLTMLTRNPERRTGQERRSGIDRRNGQKDRGELAVERRDTFKVSDVA